MDVRGFGVEEPDCLDVVADHIFPQCHHFFRRVGNLEQVFRGFVDPHIGGLSGQDDGHKQREWIDVVQLALWFRALLFKSRKNCPLYTR